jgi:lycopene cyclase domain-containing protein
VYWVWDIAVTARGHWVFNPHYVLGIELFGLPLEEWLFFVIIAFVSVFTYEAVRATLGRKR